MITQTPKHVNDGFEKRDGFQKPCSPTLKNPPAPPKPQRDSSKK